MKHICIRLAAMLALFSGQSFGVDPEKLLVKKVVEDDTAMPGGQVFRMLAEDQTSVYELACARKNGNSWPSVDKRLFKGLNKKYVPQDTACGPFTVGQEYSVFFHAEDPQHSHVTGRLVTFTVEEATSHEVTRMVVFKVEKAESK